MIQSCYMRMNASQRCLALSLVGMAVMSASAWGDDAKLILQATSQSKQGEKMYTFALTAPSDRPVYYIADKDTGIVLHDAEEQKGTKWNAIGTPWCANPIYPKLGPGKTAEIAVTAPATKRPWRIGIKLYDQKPAANVKFTEVWSTPVK